MASSIIEPARTITVADEADLVVVGGGLAGVAAAVAAARLGARVIVIERSFGLGGLATLGNVTVWLPLCDGFGRQVTAGLAEELLRLSVADLAAPHKPARFEPVPDCWNPGGDLEARRRERYLCHFNPSAYLLALEAWLLEAGVTPWFDTRLCTVRRDGDRLTHAIVENKDGRTAIACGAMVDASGDADACALAGEATVSLDSNVLAGWWYALRGGALQLHAMSKPFSPNADREGAEGPFFRGDVAAEVTAQLVGSRRMLRERLAALRAERDDPTIQPLMPPQLPCFRMTRRLASGFEPRDADQHVWVDDAVGLISDWRRKGPVWALPLRCLTASRTSNLLTAGRCISVAEDLWDVTRCLPGVTVTGQAAGVAAHLAARGELTVDAVQRALADQGAWLDPALVRPATA